jgi:hypothetical protein
MARCRPQRILALPRQSAHPCRAERCCRLTCNAQQQAATPATATPPGADDIRSLCKGVTVGNDKLQLSGLTGVYASQDWRRSRGPAPLSRSRQGTDVVQCCTACKHCWNRLRSTLQGRSSCPAITVCDSLALQALADLEQRMAASPVDTPDRETQRWFLRDRKFNVDEAVEKLEAAQQWRREFRCSGDH